MIATPIRASSPSVRKRMQRQRERDTTLERQIRSLLHARGLRFYVHRQLLADVRREVDIVFPTVRLAVFVDGCWWHGCPQHVTWPKSNAQFWRQKIEANRVRDIDTTRRLENEDWRVVRIWEHTTANAAAMLIEANVLDYQNFRNG
ncbi:MAG: very short patch repair endonuclease [Solirubrobacteraceae bacterium]|jgi:DNA mismatch endonuclease (patch repair protein)